MTLQWIYHAIVVFVAILVAGVILRTESLSRQICGGIVLVILLLRVFLVK